ncbi:hypothetical protein [Budvicia aquatica]|uniref:Uncharacterized protein n=1 Tax=Budvicia aquatica TaxID=82979 RepID=A0A2C6DDV0_9GAMM|nr:hypothetical protein [Budvicia aquatica]PHI28478.1 hypothetical protein CRN84_03615 [Budvicia aquatica]VFS46414.1 Uncharacterised protein [Budvicia aquatica]
MSLSTEQKMAILLALLQQQAIAEKEFNKAKFYLLSDRDSDFYDDATAISWLLKNQIIGARQDSIEDRSTRQPESKIAQQQRHTQELLTQLLNTDFINQAQFGSISKTLMARPDLKFNTAYHLFAWLVEQGMASPQPDHQATTSSIKAETERLQSDIRDSSRQSPSPEDKKKTLTRKLLFGFGLIIILGVISNLIQR